MLTPEEAIAYWMMTRRWAEAKATQNWDDELDDPDAFTEGKGNSLTLAVWKPTEVMLDTVRRQQRILEMGKKDVSEPEGRRQLLAGPRQMPTEFEELGLQAFQGRRGGGREAMYL